MRRSTTLFITLIAIGIFLLFITVMVDVTTDPMLIGTASKIPWSLIGIIFIGIGIIGLSIGVIRSDRK